MSSDTLQKDDGCFAFKVCDLSFLNQCTQCLGIDIDSRSSTSVYIIHVIVYAYIASYDHYLQKQSHESVNKNTTEAQNNLHKQWEMNTIKFL